MILGLLFLQVKPVRGFGITMCAVVGQSLQYDMLSLNMSLRFGSITPSGSHNAISTVDQG